MEARLTADFAIIGIDPATEGSIVVVDRHEQLLILRSGNELAERFAPHQYGVVLGWVYAGRHRDNKVLEGFYVTYEGHFRFRLKKRFFGFHKLGRQVQPIGWAEQPPLQRDGRVAHEHPPSPSAIVAVLEISPELAGKCSVGHGCCHFGIRRGRWGGNDG